MKVTIFESCDEENFQSEYSLYIDKNGEQVLGLEFCDGEPEDNNLGRNFADIYTIPTLIRLAYEAGKNGENLEISYPDEEKS